MCPPEPQAPREVFEQFLARLRAGEGVDFDGLVTRHPKHEEALRRLWKEHRKAEAAIEDALPAARKGISFFGRQKEAPPPSLGRRAPGGMLRAIALALIDGQPVALRDTRDAGEELLWRQLPTHDVDLVSIHRGVSDRKSLVEVAIAEACSCRDPHQHLEGFCPRLLQHDEQHTGCVGPVEGLEHLPEEVAVAGAQGVDADPLAPQAIPQLAK